MLHRPGYLDKPAIVRPPTLLEKPGPEPQHDLPQTCLNELRRSLSRACRQRPAGEPIVPVGARELALLLDELERRRRESSAA